MPVVSSSINQIADAVAVRLKKHQLSLTIGGEPSYVPLDPQGAEWNVTAIGPDKLRYAYALAQEIATKSLPGALLVWSPGKSYPGEVNPRWALHVVWNRDGSPLAGKPVSGKMKAAFGKKRLIPTGAPSPSQLKLLCASLSKRLRIENHWLFTENGVAVLPLDHDGKRWRTECWPFANGKESNNRFELLMADGPAGLRLPLGLLPESAMKRALVMEPKEDGLHIFIPPFLQGTFLKLIGQIQAALRLSKIKNVFWESYLPGDDANRWRKISLTPDPGVLEVNLPPCESVREYGWWLKELETRTATVGLRSFKQISPEESVGTGGGNHIIFGGPNLEKNPFFTRPAWVTSILRYWQHHPSLSYFFTGNYVGASSQAPRPDESSRALYDLEMAYRFLESLPADLDNRYTLNETLRHLHTDASGNTHRSEISFDKFCNTSWAGGCLGLVEFRAIETMPHAEWMAAIAVLWQAIALMLFEKPFQKPLLDHGLRLQDRFFLPTLLWEDFERVLADLNASPAWKSARNAAQIFREIWEWRFPQMLAFEQGKTRLSIRRGCEGWPLLCETPLEGGTTSRFVDTSMERLEFVANQAFAQTHRIFVQGRELKLGAFPGGQFGAGLRYRRSALNPSLHPAIPPQMPLFVALSDQSNRAQPQLFRLDYGHRLFQGCSEKPPRRSARACQKMGPALVTCDLRIP